MQNEDTQLANLCHKLTLETDKANLWLDDNAHLVSDLKDQKQFLRKAKRLFKNCQTAANRKMCIGVFGPSQAGKSYLVSTLAGNQQRKLWTTLGDTTCDFLTDINPAGGKESTGLVTRFTLTKNTSVAPDFPIAVRLLTVGDIAKIITNTYYSDARHMEEPDRKAMLTKLDELEKRAQASPTGGFTEDDGEELQEYVAKYFGDRARVQQLLNQSFWDRLVPLAPRLSDEDRAELLGLIWEDIEEFNALFLGLSRVLRSLQYAADAFCPKSALLPRDESIIDVEALSNLSTGDSPSIEIMFGQSQRISVPKVYLAALTTELVISMNEKPADFFEHTDLLDFPGYRSRETFTNLAEKLKEPKNLELCFLRGKVEYLFQRYCTERELTGLLLCIGPSVLEVKGLSSAVDEWVKSTHGETPEARGNKNPALFFILSKSDMEFESKAGVTDVSDRWDIRIESSLIKSFAQHSEWPMQWSQTSNFKNLFLMRNPTIKLALFDHNAENQETNIRPSENAYVEQFKTAFINSPHVNRFCPAPIDMWEAFMTPNDGGLSLIRTLLEPISKPEIKRGQIATTLDEAKAKLLNRLTPYWKTDNKEDERKEKAALSQLFARTILTMAQNQRFGQFQRHLMLRDQDVYELYFQAQHKMQEDLAAGASVTTSTAVGPRFSAEDMMSDLFGESPPPSASVPDSTDQETGQKYSLPKDEAEAFTLQIEQFWTRQLSSKAEDPVLQERFSFSAKEFSQFIHEIGVGFIRLGFRATIEEELRKSARYSNVDKERTVWKQASLAANIVNAFIDWLGYDPRTCTEDERTINIGNKSRMLFINPAEVTDLPVLHEEPLPYDRTFYTDWAGALMHLVTENINFDGQQNFDPEQNLRLKAILDILRIKVT